MRKESEIVIIGAGIMGSSLAYHLAKRGKEVTVREMNEICSGTSSTTAAWLWPSDKRPMYYGRLAKEAYDMYMTLEEELGADFELRINGSLEIARNQEELEDLKKLSAGCVELGYNARILTPEETLEMEPSVRKDIVGANYVESDGHLNPFLLVNAYIQAAKKFGAEVNTYTKVEDFILEDNRIIEIVTNKGSIKPGLVVCAAGIYSRGLGQKLGLNAHVKPERGFTLVTEKLPHVLNHTVCGARQTVSGNIILGFIADKVDDDCLDRRMYIRGLNWAAKDAIKLGLKGVVKKVMSQAPPFYYAGFSEEQKEDILNSLVNITHLNTCREEYRLAHDDEALRNMVSKDQYPDIPIILVTHSSEEAILENMEFGRYLSVIVTPFNEDNTINYDAMRRIAQRMIDGGVEGLIVAATGGESATLSLAERVELTKFMKAEFGDQVPIIVGTGNNNTAASIETTKQIEEAGADAVLLVSPYYNKPSQEGLYRHFKAIAESTKLPVFLYNVPGRTGVSIAPKTVKRLAEVPNIYGMKDASGNMDNLTNLLNTVPERFRVYTGDDNLAIPALSIGVYGLISVCAQVVPAEIKAMMDLFREGKLAEAAACHRKLFPILDVLFIASNPVPTKVALNLMGYEAGIVRLPLTMPSKDQTEAIAEELLNLGLIDKIDIPKSQYI